MIDFETFQKIKLYHAQQGLKVAQIARQLALDVRTVAYWVEQLNFRPRKSATSKSKLDPFKPAIIRMLETHPYSAVQIFYRIREDGYQGGITILRNFVQKVRPKRAPAFLTLAFAPGECAQVDWGEYGTVQVGSTRRRLSFFLMVLCHSRMMYLEFFVSQTMEHFLAGHQNAFAFFGGVPKKVMVDNLKSAVLKRVIGKAPVFNPRFLDFANHHGFTIVPCAVGKGNEKGRVENGVGYVKKNFLNGLGLQDFHAINPTAQYWQESVANVRLHGETKKRPLDMFLEEKPALGPLPGMPHDIGTVHTVRASNRFRISFEANRYSVPSEYASQRLILKVYPDRLCIYHQNNLIASHSRCYDRNRDIEDPDHPRELLAQRRQAGEQKLLMRFLTLSPKAQEFYQELEKRRLNSTTHVRKIVALSEIYSQETVARALEDALSFKACSSEYVANILEQRSRHRPEPGILHVTRRQDLLEIEIPAPNLKIYERNH
ncbi:MAG: IS21 family transposase [Magnetococcales bacterium]|nr:IS21 family transposase [Magnetococcales bacterium]MBF0429005.1 IS21 family transposase [Magnetococcales bacterium]